MMPLTLHEAVPGHHFQFARGLEMPDAPMFRKTAYFVSYGEAGPVPRTVGLRHGPVRPDLVRPFGELTYEMAHAIRNRENFCLLGNGSNVFDQ